MTHESHRQSVQTQFGSQAAAYVQSRVHATGRDLERLAELARTRRAERALDLGCGGGHATYAIAPFADEVVAVDLAGEMLQATEREAAARGLTAVTTAAASVDALPIDDRSFDLVVSRFSAHHWRSLSAGLAEARRVLRPGGVAVFIDVVAPESPVGDTFLQAVEVLRDRSHVRDRRISEWERVLQSVGFTVAEVRVDRLELRFAEWVARMRTPQDERDAIGRLWRAAPAEVVEHFAVDLATGDFTVDTAWIACS